MANPFLCNWAGRQAWLRSLWVNISTPLGGPFLSVQIEFGTALQDVWHRVLALGARNFAQFLAPQ